MLGGALVSLIVPVVAYFVIRPHVSGDTAALTIAAAIPVARTLWIGLTKHRVDPLGLLGTFGYGVSVAMSLLMGGSSLPVKFVEPVITGVLGLAFLASLTVGRPLLLVLVHRGTPLHALPPRMVRTARVVTAIIGPTLALHAALHITLALTLSTGAFLVWSRVLGWGVLAAGAAVVYLYVRSRRHAAV
jgi:hypothetical protein